MKSPNKAKISSRLLYLLASIGFIVSLAGGCPAIRHIPVVTMGTKEWASQPDSIVIDYEIINDSLYMIQDTFWPRTDNWDLPNDPFKTFNDQLAESISAVPWIQEIKTRDNGTADTTFYFHQLKRKDGGRIPIDISALQVWRISFSSGYDQDGLFDTMWKYDPYTDNYGNSVVNYWAGFLFATHCLWNTDDNSPEPGICQFNTNTHGEPVAAISEGAMEEDSRWTKDDIRSVIAHEMGHEFNFYDCSWTSCLMYGELNPPCNDEFSDECPSNHFELLTDSINYRP